MGLFAEYQPLYAAHGIATFPVRIEGKDKKPAVRNYLRAGHRASRAWAATFPDVDAFGFVLGKRSGVSVLDIDTPDEQVLADALDRHGSTPLIVRSGSGNFQAWYRHNGEDRLIRPWPGLPIDQLGGGYVAAPPSRATRGSYEIIQGSLEDLDRLPVMRGLGVNDNVPAPSASTPQNGERIGRSKPWCEMRDGDGRNNALMREVARWARACDDEAQLLDWAHFRNGEFAEPLPEHEVAAMVAHWWRKTEVGSNWFGTGRIVTATHDEVDLLAASDPDALALLLKLKRHHSDRDWFILAADMARSMSWTEKRWRSARGRLEEHGRIHCWHRGGKGLKDPPIYGWTPKSDDWQPIRTSRKECHAT